MKSFPKPAIMIIASLAMLLLAAALIISLLLYHNSNLTGYSTVLYWSISMSVILSSILIFNVISKKNQIKAPIIYLSSVPSKIETKEIPYPLALDCKKHYRHNNDGKAITDSNGELIEFWSLDMSVVRNTYEDPSTKESRIKQLLLIPISTPVKDKPTSGITILIAATDKDDKIIDRKFLEYLKPCPDNCNESYNQLFNKTTT